MSNYNQLNTKSAAFRKHINHDRPDKRSKDFEKLVTTYRMNDNHSRIQEFSESDQTNPYILKIRGLTGMQPPRLVKRAEDWQLFSAQFHLTFFYSNKA